MGNINGIHPASQLLHILPASLVLISFEIGLTPCILQSPSFGDHGVLLCGPPAHVMHVSGIVNLPSQRSSLISSLLSSQDMEVIIRRMSSSMTLSSNSRAEDDQIPSISSILTRWSKTYSVIEAWMMYILPIAPAALLNTHSEVSLKSTWKPALG
jgi:hypothetical protein